MPGPTRRRRPLALLVLAGSTWLACAPPAPPRGVVMVLLDTLRADHLSAYGYERPTSPRIDAFASQASLFENAVSPSPWTLPAVATLMTSLYPSVHGASRASRVNDFEWMLEPEAFRPVSALDSSRTTLAEILKRAGFATAAWVRGSYTSRAFGLDQGFDVFADNTWPGFRFNVEEALAWLDREKPQRFFVYIHVMEIHSPYVPAAEGRLFLSDVPEARKQEVAAALAEEGERYQQWDFDPDYTGSLDGSWEQLELLRERPGGLAPRDVEHLAALYDRGIAYTDYWVGRLLDGLAERGLQGETLVVLTSDHGDEFLEHGGLEHTRTYYEEMVRVPLILRVPGLAEGARVTPQVGLIDVLPTVLDVLGVETDTFTQGRSLVPLLRGEQLPERTYFTEASQIPGLFGSRTNRWKYVQQVRGPEELYDLERDPAEQSDLCRQERERCSELRSQLRGFRREMDRAAETLDLPEPAPASVDERTRRQLRTLGYTAE